MRKYLIALFVLLSLLSPVAEATIKVSETPRQKTVLEDIYDLLTNVYDNVIFCQSIYETKGYPFLVYPRSGQKYPSNIPIIVNGRFPKNLVKVRIWDITDSRNPIFFRSANFLYQLNYKKLRYNLHLQNNKKYQVKVYVRDRLVVSQWFVETIDRDENFVPPIPPIVPSNYDDD